tara:strand:+ start:220 stop:351 length:132 start_codon:yes stop_codon:yes gene_type:complete
MNKTAVYKKKKKKATKQGGLKKIGALKKIHGIGPKKIAHKKKK